MVVRLSIVLLYKKFKSGKKPQKAEVKFLDCFLCNRNIKCLFLQTSLGGLQDYLPLLYSWEIWEC